MEDYDFDKMQFNIEKFVKVTDNWNPNYKGNKIKMILDYSNYSLPSPKGMDYWQQVRCVVWGTGDFGLEKIFHSSDKQELKEKFFEFKKNYFDNLPDVVDKQYFYDLGFTQIEG